MPISKKMSMGSIIKKEMAHGKPQKQSVAIAYSVKRKKSDWRKKAKRRID